MLLDKNNHLANIIREELTELYLSNREHFSKYLEELEKLEMYFRYVTDVHSPGTHFTENPDHFVLLKLVSDLPMQWAFPGRLVFTIAPNALKRKDFSQVQLHLTE